MASPESSAVDPEAIRPIFDTVRGDVDLIDQHAADLREYTNSLVTDAAMMLDSVGIFPTVPVYGADDTYRPLLYVGRSPFQEDREWPKRRLYLHTDGSIWRHQIVSLSTPGGVRGISRPIPLSAEERFKAAKEALESISYVLAFALNGKTYKDRDFSNGSSSRVVVFKEEPQVNEQPPLQDDYEAKYTGVLLGELGRTGDNAEA